MITPPTPETTLDDNAINEILEQYNSYLFALVKKSIPQRFSNPDTFDLDIDEFAQTVRIKLWQALKRRPISHITAYIRCIIHTETVNLLRQHASICYPLPMTDEGELYQGNVLMTLSEGMHDPLYEVEQEEVITKYITSTVDAVVNFPQVQRKAMICYLKDKLENVIQLTDAFREHEITIEEEHWPDQKSNLRSYRSSISVAKGKLRTLLINSEGGEVSCWRPDSP